MKQDEKNNQILNEVSQIVAAMLTDKFEAVLADTLERIFSSAAKAAEEAAQIEVLKSKPYLTEKELAMLVPISTETLRAYRSRGLGPRYIKAPGREDHPMTNESPDEKRKSKVMYSRAEVDNFYSCHIVDTRRNKTS